MRHLPEDLLATRPEINWSDIRAFGNFVRDEYWRVDPKIVWRVVGDKLPALRTAIADMLPERRVELTADLPNAKIDAVEVAQMAPGLSHLNAEVDEKRWRWPPSQRGLRILRPGSRSFGHRSW